MVAEVKTPHGSPLKKWFRQEPLCRVITESFTGLLAFAGIVPNVLHISKNMNNVTFL